MVIQFETTSTAAEKKTTSAVATRIVLILYFLNNYYVISMASIWVPLVPEKLFILRLHSKWFYILKSNTVWFIILMKWCEIPLGIHTKKKRSKMNSVRWIIWNVILTIWKHPSCFADCFSGCFLSHQRVVSSNFKWFLDERRLRSWYQRWHWYWRQTRRHHVIDLIWFWFWFLSCVVQHIHARL